MKIYFNTTEDWKEIKQAVKDAEKILARFNVSITLNKIDLDLSDKLLYENTDSLSWFTINKTKSLSNPMIRAIGILNGGQNYDYYGIIVDKKKSKEKSSLYGQHSRTHRTLEVYADKRNKLRYGLPQITSTVVHEILHALSDELGKQDKLHDYLKKYNQMDKYIEYLKPSVKGLLPLVERQMNAFLVVANNLGFDLRVTSNYRSHEEQDELYAQGRTKPGNIVTNAKGGESFHNWGVAFDIVDRKKGYNLTNGEWGLLAKIWEYLTDGQGVWGGSWVNFVDKPHFQNTLGYSLKDFQFGKVDYTRYN